MSIYFYIFLGSLVLIVGMFAARLLYEKLHDEHIFHRLVTWRARKMDWHLKERIQKYRRFLRYFNKKTFSLFIHLVIEVTEEYFHKITKFIKSKLPHHHK